MRGCSDIRLAALAILLLAAAAHARAEALVALADNWPEPLTGFNAGPGFDLASGWGSIDIGQFVNAFVSSTPAQ